jgi:Domain of unknown function (DUF4384)
MLAARQRVPDLAALPAPLRPVIAPMLEPQPDDRPPSMRALLGYEGEGLRKLARRTQTSIEGSWRRRAMLAVLAVGALGVLAGATLFVLHEVKPPPTTAGLRAALASATAGYQCASVDYAVNPDRSVRIAGYAASEADIAQIRQAVGSIDGIAKLDFAVELRIWPYCEVIAMLQNLIAHPPRVAASLALLSTSGTAHLGEPLVVDVRAPSIDSYLYVDYFNRQGEVLHLFPNGQDRLNFRPAQNHLILGEPPFGRCWVLGGISGEQLVTLVAAVGPLFPQARPEAEDARAYLPSLSQAVDALSPDRGAAALRLFQLAAAPPFASRRNTCR